MNHLVELAKPYPAKFVKDDGRGNSYVPHHIVTQRLIQIFGAPPKIEILREIYDRQADGSEKLTGVVMRLTVPGLEPVEEAGEADNPQSKTNGARAKDACSDAIKRCAMRLGNGLGLWSQNDYFLYDVLQRDLQKGRGEADNKGSVGTAQPERVKEETQPAPAPSGTLDEIAERAAARGGS